MLLVIIPLLPGMIAKIAGGSIHLNEGLQHLFSFNYLYGFCLSVAMYWTLNILSPDKRTLVREVVHGTPKILEGVEVDVGDGKGMSEMEHGKASKEARSTESYV